MRIVFFATAEFAIPSFRALLASGHDVVALVTQPDRKRGRSLKLSPPVTKVMAESCGVPVYQPEDASSPESVAYLNSLSADLFVVIAFGQILKQEVLSIPRLSAINLHGSLLPEYRGAAPTNWAIINGEAFTGVTVIKLNERMDDGDIVLKRKFAVGKEETNITLNESLSALGAELLIESIGLIASGKATFEKQERSRATFAPKLKKEDGAIDWKKPAVEIERRIRGLLPWPAAYTSVNGKTIKILKGSVISAEEHDRARPGEVVEILKGRGIAVKTGRGRLLISHVQLEGSKAMDADSFLRGHRLGAGDAFAGG